MSKEPAATHAPRVLRSLPGRELAALRRRAGLTRAGMARAAGVGRRAVS